MIIAFIIHADAHVYGRMSTERDAAIDCSVDVRVHFECFVVESTWQSGMTVLVLD